MNWHSRCFAALLVLLLASFAFAADNEGYGFQPGTVVGWGAGGGTFASGMTGFHPTIGAGLDIGFHKYLGIFVEGGYSRVMNENITACAYGYCASANAKASMVQGGGGLEVVATNQSRFVPYGKIGMGYVRGIGSASSGGYSYGTSAGAPAILGGGGFRAYLNGHFGIDIQVTGLRTVGNNGGGTTGVVTVGVFVQSMPKGAEHTAHSNGEIKVDSAKFAAKQNAPATPIAPMPTAEGPKPTNDNLNKASTQLPNESPKPIDRVVKPELRITSEPSGAEIEVNGQFIGNTPTTVVVSDGRVVVKVKKSGFQPWERTLTMNPGDKRTLNAEMENGGVIKLPK